MTALFVSKFFQIYGNLCYQYGFEAIYVYVEKIKDEKFGCEVGKSVILCQFIIKLIQIPDNDRLSRRIRGYFRRKGSLSSAGRYQETIAGRGRRVALLLTGVLKNV